MDKIRSAAYSLARKDNDGSIRIRCEIKSLRLVAPRYDVNQPVGSDEEYV